MEDNATQILLGYTDQARTIYQGREGVTEYGEQG